MEGKPWNADVDDDAVDVGEGRHRSAAEDLDEVGDRGGTPGSSRFEGVETKSGMGLASELSFIVEGFMAGKGTAAVFLFGLEDAGGNALGGVLRHAEPAGVSS